MIAVAIIAVLAGIRPAEATDSVVPATCDGTEAYAPVNYVNDSDYDQSVEVSVDGELHAGIILPPGGSIESFPLGASVTEGGELMLHISNAVYPVDGIQVIRMTFGPVDCSAPPTTTSTVPVDIGTPATVVNSDAYVTPSSTVLQASEPPMPLSIAGWPSRSATSGGNPRGLVGSVVAPEMWQT